MINLIALMIVVKISKPLRNNYIKKCKNCDEELDIEDYFFNNSCEYCGSTQGYDREYYENEYKGVSLK
jgi:rRNA maturation endonuclease Nob1